MGAEGQGHLFPVNMWVVAPEPLQAENDGRLDLCDVKQGQFAMDSNSRADHCIFSDGIGNLSIPQEQGAGGGGG
jgi:hypothetical protein